MRRSAVVLVLVAAMGAGLPRAARAETVEQEVQHLSDDAVEAYRAGRYQKAVELLTRAYAIRPITNLLYNLGKAYDKLNDADNAYAFYKKYVDSGEAEAKLESKARDRMAFFQPQLKPNKPPEVVAPPLNNGNNKPPEVTPPPKTGPTPEELQAQKEEAWRRKKTLNLVGGIVMASAGLGCIGAGIGLYASSSSLHDQFGMTTDEDTKRQLRDDAQLRGILSSVMYGVGAALILGSAWFFYAGIFRPMPADEGGETKVTFAPWIGPGGAGAEARWRF
jgi:tetratricopeptide (TPR) repeat protein